MKILRIKNNKGEYSVNGDDYKNISEISKEDILLILSLIIDDSDSKLEFEQIDDTNSIPNDAEKIIYEKIYKKLLGVKKERQNIIEQVNKEIEPILTKYNITLDEKIHKPFHEARKEKTAQTIEN